MKKFLRSNAPFAVFVTVVVIGYLVFVSTFTSVKILTGSMVPTFSIGSSVLIVKSDGNNLKTDQIITFHETTTGKLETHRFLGYAQDGSLNTQGDANVIPDTRHVALQKSDVVGTVAYLIPSQLTGFWATTKGLGLIMVLIVSVLGAIIYFAFFGKKKDKDVQKVSAPEETPEPSLTSV